MSVRFAHLHLPVAADVVEGYAGPLAGVLTGMEWMRGTAPGVAWVAIHGRTRAPAERIRRGPCSSS